MVRRGPLAGFFDIMNYRKLYAKHYGITIPSDYDIHHKDGNRANNAIANLILLPKKVHASLHLICNVFGKGIDGMQLMKIAMNPHQIDWFGSYFELLADIVPELIWWTTAKAFEDYAISQNTKNALPQSYNHFRNDIHN